MKMNRYISVFLMYLIITAKLLSNQITQYKEIGQIYYVHPGNTILYDIVL